jgi:hypothetical protein
VFARIFAKDEISSNTQELTRRKIWLSLWIISFLSFASMLALRIHREETFALWMYVIVQSFLLISGMAYNWYLDVKEPYFDAPGAMILDKAALGAFSLKYEKKSRRLKKPPPLFVPTGIEVQSMRFSGAGEVELSGLIWQKYRDRAHDGLSRGVLMPQASEFRLEEAYRRRTGEVETIGWAFKCVLDQRFDLRRYPGDSRMVSVRVLHRDFDSNVLLVPDLESYRIMNPNALPGLRDGFAMSGWNIRKSYFSFRDSTSNATMGIAGSVRETAFPDLYFNVFSTRSVIAPAISHLLPVGVAVCILFAVLLVITRHSEMLNRFGYTTLSTVGACSGLFFGVLLAHARLRGEVHADGFTYLETYHFTTYLATLLISVNSFLFNSSMQISFIQYRDNLYPKLLYWPVLLSVLLGITVWTYY